MQFDGLQFSDGSSLSYSVRGEARIYDSSSDGISKAFTDDYRQAVFKADQDVTIVAEAGPCSTQITIASPVTAGKIVDALMAYYSQPLTEAMYKHLEYTGFLKGLNKSMFPTMEAIKQYFTTYGSLCG